MDSILSQVPAPFAVVSRFADGSEKIWKIYGAGPASALYELCVELTETRQDPSREALSVIAARWDEEEERYVHIIGSGEEHEKPFLAALEAHERALGKRAW